MAGAFDDLLPREPAARGGAFADLVPAHGAEPGAPPALLRRPAAQPSKLKRAAVNATAAFYGSDGDSAGLLSEMVIDAQSGDLRKRDARGNRGLAQLLDTVGLDGIAGKLYQIADDQAAEAAAKRSQFEAAQQRRRQAVADLGPAQGIGDKVADFGGRVAASLPQPENFVGGPALKGASLGGKVLRSGSAAAGANLATEPVLQTSAVRRGTRDRLSVKDAAVNTAVAFGTGSAFGVGAHVVEKVAGRGAKPVTKPAGPAGAFDDLVPDDAPSAAVGAFDDLVPSDAPRPSQVEPFTPNAAPQSQPGGGIVADVRDLAAGTSVDAALGDMVQPEDVLPLRGRQPRPGDNRVSSLAEAERANPSSVEPLAIPDERDAFQTRRLASRDDSSRGQYRAQPMDLVSALRRAGGIREYSGELGHLGIDNQPRNMDFARDEQFLGRLVDNERGMDVDDAAQWAFEQGYFPDLAERPDVETFMEALARTHRGDNRVFHPNDWEALADYRSRLGDRMRMEQASRDGAPAATVRGEPVGPDDLDARALPVEAYHADIPAAAEMAGNIRTDLLDSPQSIHRALKEIAAKVNGFEDARRGIIRQDQTRELAAELGMTAADLLKRRKGQALNAEQALAARQLLAKSGNDLVRLARAAKGGSDEDLAAFRAALLQHAAIQEQVAGMTAEAGRLLGQFRMIANSRDAVRGPVIRGDVVRSVIDGGGGRGHLEDVAEKLLEQGGNPVNLNRLALAGAKPTARDKFMEVYINSLLSGPQTHAVNILSNAITAIGQVPETLAAATVGAVRRAVTLGKGNPDRVLFTEAGSRAVGMIQGAREGLRLAKTAFRTGEPSDFVGAIENSQYRAISGRKGELIRIPTRALTAEDEFFKAIARRMEVNALAVRKAAAEGLRGQAARDRIAELTANPTDEMLEKAIEYARYQTFQRKLGTFGQTMLNATNNRSGGGAVAKWLFPFLRTPINLMKYTVERSPLAPLLGEWRADFKAGGARRDIALGRALMGSGVAGLVASWAAEGTITGGGPADAEQRALMMAEGWRPYSIRIGDKFYSYERLDPLATTLGTVADIVERSNDASDKDSAEATTAVLASILNNLGGGIFLDTMADLADAVQDPSRFGQQFLSSQASKLVPAVVGQTAATIDPVIREAKAPLDRIKSRVPGLSTSLYPRRDIWGEPMKRPGRLGPDIASPLPVGEMKGDPLNRELTRLDVQVGKLQRKIGDVQLTAAEYDAYQVEAGRLMRQYVREEMRSPDWRQLDSSTQAGAIKEAIKDARADAREAMRERFPNLRPVE